MGTWDGGLDGRPRISEVMIDLVRALMLVCQFSSVKYTSKSYLISRDKDSYGRKTLYPVQAR